LYLPLKVVICRGGKGERHEGERVHCRGHGRGIGSR